MEYSHPFISGVSVTVAHRTFQFEGGGQHLLPLNTKILVVYICGLFLIQQSVRLNQTLKIERNNKIGSERIREDFTLKMQMKRYILPVS